MQWMKHSGAVRYAPLAVAALWLLTAPAASVVRAGPPVDASVDHVVVIFQENHSFDNLFGDFPGADGLSTPAADTAQVTKAGAAYRALPQPLNTGAGPGAADRRFPATLANQPFNIGQYVPAEQKIGDLVHRYYQHQLQVNGGRMDKHVAWSDAGALTMGHYSSASLPLYDYAQNYTLMDRFFQGAYGGSFLNHQFLICACAPSWPHAPADVVARPEYDALGNLTGLAADGAVTPDGFAVNTVQPTYQPHQAGVSPDHRLPPQQAPTIGARMDAAGVSWKWYAGGWNDALAGRPSPSFQFHHQPFAYYADYADGTAAKAAHLQDENAFYADLENGALPSVSFIKPQGDFSEHAGYADLISGQQHVVDIIERVKASPDWQNTVIIVTYDEFGGFYDHVAPPAGDRWGPGSRVPTLVISPYAKKGYIDHTTYDASSILKFIEWRWGLAPLTERDAQAANLLNAFDFAQQPVDAGTAETSAPPPEAETLLASWTSGFFSLVSSGLRMLGLGLS